MILQQQQFQQPEVIASMIPLSITETLADLRQRGYRYKFRREANCLYCIDLGSWFMPDGFTVDEYYHFEDSSNTHGDMMLYAISAIHGLKGFLVDTCFVYADSNSLDVTEKGEWEYELADEIFA